MVSSEAPICCDILVCIVWFEPSWTPVDLRRVCVNSVCIPSSSRSSEPVWNLETITLETIMESSTLIAWHAARLVCDDRLKTENHSCRKYLLRLFLLWFLTLWNKVFCQAEWWDVVATCVVRRRIRLDFFDGSHRAAYLSPRSPRDSSSDLLLGPGAAPARLAPLAPYLAVNVAKTRRN